MKNINHGFATIFLLVRKESYVFESQSNEGLFILTRVKIKSSIKGHIMLKQTPLFRLIRPNLPKAT